MGHNTLFWAPTSPPFSACSPSSHRRNTAGGGVRKKIRRFFHRKKPSLDAGQSRSAGGETGAGAEGEVRPPPLPATYVTPVVASAPTPPSWLSLIIPLASARPSRSLCFMPVQPAALPTNSSALFPPINMRQMPPWVRQGSGSRAGSGTSPTQMHLGTRDERSDYGYGYPDSATTSRGARRPSAVRQLLLPLPLGVLWCGGATLVVSGSYMARSPRARTLWPLLTPFCPFRVPLFSVFVCSLCCWRNVLCFS